MKTFIGRITAPLHPNQVLMVTTNTQGRHGMGIAKFAHDKLGLPHGFSIGQWGACYCIVTKDLTQKDHPSIPKDQIIRQVVTFYEHAYWEGRFRNAQFLVPFIAGSKPLSGYSIEDFAEMFTCIQIPENIVFEKGFAELIKQRCVGKNKT